MKCPYCGAETFSKVCEYCGSEMPHENSEMVINLNQTVVNNCYYNEKCEQVISNKSISSKRKSVALIWCVFLGMFGAHYFYIGKIGKGILYLFTAGLFGFGWIIDIIRIASGSFTDSKGFKMEPMSLKEKGHWFIGLFIFGFFGIITGISEQDGQTIGFYLIWTGLFGVLFYFNRRKQYK